MITATSLYYMKDFSIKNKMLRSPYMVLLALLFVGLGSAYAVNEYSTTLSGDYHITGNLLVDGNMTGPTITEFDKRITLLELTSSTAVIISNNTDHSD